MADEAGKAVWEGSPAGWGGWPGGGWPGGVAGRVGWRARWDGWPGRVAGWVGWLAWSAGRGGAGGRVVGGGWIFRVKNVLE